MSRFTIQSVNLVPISPGESFGPHIADIYSLAWILEGGGQTKIGKSSFKTRAGSVLACHPGDNLQHRWSRQTHTSQSYIFFTSKKRLSLKPHHQHFPDQSLLISLWRSLLAAPKGPHANRSFELIIDLFLSGKDPGTPPAAVPNFSEYVQRALMWASRQIENNPVFMPRLGELALQAGISQEHLCVLFKKELSASPISCMHAMKMERAAFSLENSEQTLGQTAEKLGYSSGYHLSATFKKYYGLSPAHYRKAYRQGKRVRPSSLLLRNHPMRRLDFDQRWNLKK